MAVDELGNLFTWGKNSQGELGYDDRYSREWLSQLRVHDSQAQGMCCKRVFCGGMFT